jgi:acetyl-CoA carboxylase carboxyltransferase component
LVKTQLQLAAGRSLCDLGFAALPPEKPRGFAIELRIKAESLAEDGSVRPAHGAIAMSGGADDAALFPVSWPTGEFGPMALEGAAKLGYRNELAAISDPVERKKRFDDMVAGLYQRGKALNVATHFAIDDVIDPADSRRWIINSLRSTPVVTRRTTKKYPFVECW